MHAPLGIMGGLTAANAARAGIGRWITYYNTERPHSALGGRTPCEAHSGTTGSELAA